MINAIICEFNPFHNGHKYLIDTAKQKTGADATVCIMSGNFVQRGDCALWDKHTRAAAAIMGGADLVLQIPTAHTLAGAQVFARSGVYIAKAMGLDTTLCFGSESEDISALFDLADIEPNLLSAHFKDAISSGLSYAAAYQSAYEKCGRDAQILKSPNNLLAFEYIKAAKGSGLSIVNVERKGDAHDGDSPQGGFASASFIRKNLKEDMSSYAPSLAQVSVDRQKLLRLALFSIYNKSEAQLSQFADMSEGIENRFYEAASDARSFSQLCEKVKSRRYTAAKIRRMAMGVLIGNPKGLFETMPDCLRVLAFNDKGRSIIRNMSHTAALPIIVKPSDCEKLDSRHFELECRASDIYDFCSFSPKGRGVEYTVSPIYIK